MGAIQANLSDTSSSIDALHTQAADNNMSAFHGLYVQLGTQCTKSGEGRGWGWQL